MAKVCITTIQRLYSLLQGEEEPSPEDEEAPLGSLESLYRDGAVELVHHDEIEMLDGKRRVAGDGDGLVGGKVVGYVARLIVKRTARAGCDL